jgi:peptidyl-prolyl cis-trans isomerase D
MLEIIRRGRRWVTAIFVVLVGGVFAVFIGLGQPLTRSSADSVVAVGPYRIGIAEFERTRSQREEQFRDALGDQFDARALRDSLDAMTARILVDRSILALEAERLGLTVAKQEVEREILASPLFWGPEGRFDKEAFDNWVSWEFGSERAFREQQRRSALAGKLLRLIQTQAVVSDGEVRQALARQLEGVRVALAVLDTGKAPDDLEVSPEDVAAFLAEREADARKLYEERADVYDVPEQLRARHILIKVAQEASESEWAAAEAKALAALGRYRDGEDFAALAQELSEDPGSKAAGGDLGLFRRGQMVAAFETAAFALEPGEVSEPVRTVYGYHLILAEERREAEQRSFEQVRDELARELLAKAAARERAWATAESLASAVREGTPLEDAARNAELTLERSGWLRRRPDGFVPGLGAAPDLMALAFTLEPGESSPRVFEVGERLALVQVLEREAPSPEEIESQLEAERERLANQLVEKLTTSWVARRRAELLEAGELAVNLDLLGRRG